MTWPFLFLVHYDLRHHVADGFEALGAALVGCILEGVPVGVVEVNEVNGGDSVVVEGDVVIADASLKAVGELRLIAQGGGGGPDLVV